MLKYFINLFFKKFYNKKYPKEWFISFDGEKYSWEILPQEAGKGEVIISKRNELKILSNFAPTPFKLYGTTYASIEGFWQSLKYPEDDTDIRYKLGINKFTREEVASMHGFEAKKAGDIASEIMLKNNINYITFKNKKMEYHVHKKGEFYQLIVNAMKAKLNQNKKVREILLKTKGLILLPDHHQDNPPPAWQYYKIWMQIRDGLL